jgi:glycosyltransferase involved in cell wall biosynthesis
MHNASVEVLFATYNSERFLKEQLDSLLVQSYQNFIVLIRDGGSTDSTLSIIKKYQEAYPDKFRFIPSQNRSGFLNNFGNLLNAGNADYTFFCDHDDIWFPEKIEKSLKKLWELESQFGLDVPCCVHCDLAIADSEGKILHGSLFQSWHMSTTPEKSGYPVEVPLYGCTMAFNKCLKNKALPLIDDCVSHDTWLGRIAWYLGHVAFIPESLIRYRIHNSNVSCSSTRRYPAVFFRYLENWKNNRTRLAKNLFDPLEPFLYRYSHELTQFHRERLQILANWRNLGLIKRSFYLLKYKIYSTGIVRTIGLLFL